jgi:cytochrome c
MRDCIIQSALSSRGTLNASSTLGMFNIEVRVAFDVLDILNAILFVQRFRNTILTEITRLIIPGWFWVYDKVSPIFLSADLVCISKIAYFLSTNSKAIPNVNQFKILACLAILSACTALTVPDRSVSNLNPAKSPIFNQPVWASGNEQESGKFVDSTRFTHTTLVSGLDEPMEMAILPNKDIVVVERKGGVRYFNNASKELKTIAQLNVFSGIEDGLLGVAIDPKFQDNNWIYLYYGVGGDKNVSHLARFELKNEQLLQTTKKVLLEIPTQRTYCCHSAGYITFDVDGLLYLSVGDNTNAEEIEGHNPTDERPGRHLSDGQASSANSNDYRGKILRIKPEVDGTYSIPDGNLFPKDGSKGKPEIYVMGLRNPFRMSIDPKTKYLYWGDVGPDTEIKAEEGKLSYDEINQARKPGFYGYPYFLGANEVFPKYDFATKKEGPGKNPLAPLNESPNNTGIKELPPAQPAFIWYGKGPSKRWPLVGKGGASAMAGPVYYSDMYPDAPYKLPDYYNGKLLIYDWVRKWIMAVTMDANGNYVSMEPFLPHLNVVAPMDIQIASDGAVYMLAYGTNWFARNTDSGIIRVEYTEGNRNPIAVSNVSKTVGAAPLAVTLSAKESMDHDAGDQLSYEWKIGNVKRTGAELKHTFVKPGVYNVVLTVSDQHGGKGSTTTQVKVGNTPPDVSIQTTENKTFFWDGANLSYQIKVKDVEDKVINPKSIKASFDYLDYGKDLASVLSGGENVNVKYAKTETLFNSLDCKACHSKDTKSIGPSLVEVSKKYKDQAGADQKLTDKIINGGTGVWGTYPMPPHLDLPRQDAEAITDYILSLAKQEEKLPLVGKLALNQHVGKGKEGAYVLQASYTDQGAHGIEPLKSSAHIVLKNPLIQMEDYSEGNVGVVIATLNTGYVSYLANIADGRYVKFEKLDLTQIRGIRFRVQEHGAGGQIEIRSGSKTGKLLGSIQLNAGSIADLKTGWKEVTAKLTPSTGIQDLYFVFKSDKPNTSLFHLDWIYFEK